MARLRRPEPERAEHWRRSLAISVGETSSVGVVRPRFQGVAPGRPKRAVGEVVMARSSWAAEAGASSG